MSNTQSAKLHIVMLPWLAYGHFIPFLHLSNKLAERGHRVSFLLPKSAQLKLEQLNQFPDLINFLLLAIPHVAGLPPGAETLSQVPPPIHHLLFSAFDQTQIQVQSYLLNLKPDLVFYDLACWVPALGRDKPKGFKSICYKLVNTVIQAFFLVQSGRLARMDDIVIVEDLMQPPPGFPSSRIRVTRNEASQVLTFFRQKSSSGLSFYERVTTSEKESDAVAMRTCYEIEGPFCNYLEKEYGKPVLLTGPLLPQAPSPMLEEKWANWLNKFEPGSLVYCKFGSQTILEKGQFQELVLGLELMGLPFLAALTPPRGCSTIEEALPEAFTERLQGRGWVYGGWVPQPEILSHPCVGCIVGHCGSGSMWESLLSPCQIVLIPQMLDQFMGKKLMVDELKVAVEVERGENLWVSKESLSRAIKSVMDKDNAVAAELKSNHAKLRDKLSVKNFQEEYIDTFVRSLQDLAQSRN